MSFERHVFISYSHIDNQPLTPEQQGWVTRFHASLQTLLSMRMGGKADIWRDDKLRGNDIFSNEILDQFPKTALLISVLTPRYLNSAWCTREINDFCHVAQRTGGLVVANKSRIFKVIKTPLDTEESLPQAVKQASGYLFYAFDKDDKTPLELDPAYGVEFADAFRRKVAQLAWDIAQLLDKLGAGATRDQPLVQEQGAEKPIVYLAECSYDRRDAREIIEGDLKLHGYTVLPDRKLPNDEADYVREVEPLLAKCRFSVHLIGQSYGGVPDGPSHKSVVVLQNELAARQSKTRLLQRVIWLPEGTRSEHLQQQTFIEALHRNAEMQIGADLITSGLENLKGAIHAALKKLEQSEKHGTMEQNAEGAEGDSRRLIYLLCHEKDRKDTLPLLKFLRERNLEVRLPIFTGDAAAVREVNQQLLMSCDAVILFYGAGDEAWKFHQQNEVKKIRGSRREKPLVADYTYLAIPSTGDKDFLLSAEEPHLISGLTGFSEAAMDAFMRIFGHSGAPR